MSFFELFFSTPVSLRGGAAENKRSSPEKLKSATVRPNRGATVAGK
jgi:hypothetical protein